MNKALKYIRRSILYAVFICLSLIFLYPFLYMIATSLKTNEDLYNFTVVWIPRTLHFNNYKMAATLIRYTEHFRNTVLVTVLSTLGQLLSCSMAGYGLARFRFHGSKFVYIIVLLAMIIPIQTIIVPEYLLYVNLKWTNTYLPLIIPSWLGYGFKGALYIFIFRQFYLGIPKELEEAARVDGCGFLRTFIRIVFPVSRSSYLVVMVLAVVWHWSNYFEPSMYINREGMGLLASGLENFAYALRLSPDVVENAYQINDENVLNNAVLMAGTFMVVLPLLVFFSIVQKKFIQGVERAGLTGE